MLGDFLRIQHPVEKNEWVIIAPLSSPWRVPRLVDLSSKPNRVSMGVCVVVLWRFFVLAGDCGGVGGGLVVQK
jgi:hypothetical protein